jgi:DNA-binding IclR family transcriptional regulator
MRRELMETITRSGRRAAPMAVERVTATLELLAGKRLGLTLTELAQQLDVPKVSLLDLLRGLEDLRYVQKNEIGRYLLGSAAISFARAALAGHDFLEAARPFLKRLARDSGETALIAYLDEEEMVAVYVDKIESESPIRYTVPLGLRRELYAASVGKALLANLSPAGIDKYLAETSFENFTDRTIVDVKKLRSELNDIRKNGFATTEDERTTGASGIAAPVLSANGAIIAGVVVAGPTSRVLPKQKRLCAIVRNTAREMSSSLGDTIPENS